MITGRFISAWWRNFTVYKTYYRASLVGNIGEPILWLFAMGFGLGGYISNMQGLSYIEYIAPGLVVTSSMYSATFECTFGSYTRLTVQRTFDAILATPVSLEEMVFAEIMWGTAKAIISGTVMLIVMTLFGLYSPGPGLIVILIAVALTGFVFAGAALSCSALSPSYDFFHYYFVIGIAPMMFLSGVFFPLERFPTVLKLFSLTMPATHSVSIIRFFFHGANGFYLLGSALFLAALGFVFLKTATHLMRKRLIV